MAKSAGCSDRIPSPRCKLAAVFANAGSGPRKREDTLPQLVDVLRGFGLDAAFFEPASAAEMQAQVRSEIQRGAKTLFSVGGDGTLQALVNAAYGSEATFCAVPTGGGNDFARALGLPPHPVQAVRSALAGEIRQVDLVKVRSANGHERLYLGGGGALLDSTTAVYGATHYRSWPGRLRYIAAAVRAYWEHNPHRVRISFYGDAPDLPWQEAVLASVLNTPTFGAGIRLAPNASIDDGWLDFALLRELPLSRLIRILPGAVWKGTLQLPDLRLIRARKVRMETEPPGQFQGDGELIGLTPVEIEVIPRAARFFAPKSTDD